MVCSACFFCRPRRFGSTHGEGATLYVNNSQTGRFAAVTDDECHNLPRSATHGCLYPPLLLFLLHNTPDLIQFEHINWGRRQKGLFDIGQVLDMRFEPLRHRLPSNSKDPGHST